MARLPLACVADTSVILDLVAGNLLSRLVKASVGLRVPDVVVAEELLSVDGQRLANQGLLQVIELPGELVIETAALMERYRRPSQNDLFGLALARAEHLKLVTGDAALRRAAETEGVETHGVLWLLDGLVEQNELSPAEACRALGKMIEAGTRLPLTEVRARLERWCE
jgi:predicted nucleic acid-binding protein